MFELRTAICVFSVFVAIIPTHLLCQMWTNSSEVEFQETISKFRNRKFAIACLLTFFIKHEIGFSCSSRAKKGKEMYKNVRCMCKVVVLLIKSIVFQRFSLPSRRWILKSLIADASVPSNDPRINCGIHFGSSSFAFLKWPIISVVLDVNQ